MGNCLSRIGRDGQELELRTTLAMAWMMARGWTDTNVPKQLRARTRAR